MRSSGFVLLLLVFMNVNAKSHANGLLSDADLGCAKVLKSGDHTRINYGIKSWFWVCFDPRQAKAQVKCDDLGYSEGEGQKAELQIEVDAEGYHHYYGLRHAVLLLQCKKMKSRLEQALARSREVCLRGDGGWPDAPGGTGGRRNTLNWVYDEYVSTAGRDVEFNSCE